MAVWLRCGTLFHGCDHLWFTTVLYHGTVTRLERAPIQLQAMMANLLDTKNTQLWEAKMGMYPGTAPSGNAYLYDPDEGDLPTDLDRVPRGVFVSDLVIGTLFTTILTKRGRQFKKGELADHLGPAQFTRENTIRKSANHYGNPFTDRTGRAMTLRDTALTGDPGLQVPKGGASCALNMGETGTPMPGRMTTTPQTGLEGKQKGAERRPAGDSSLSQEKGKKRDTKGDGIADQSARRESMSSTVETLRSQNRELRQQLIDANRHTMELQLTPLTTGSVTRGMAEEMTSASVGLLGTGTTAVIATLRALRGGPVDCYNTYIERVTSEMDRNTQRFRQATKERENGEGTSQIDTDWEG